MNWKAFKEALVTGLYCLVGSGLVYEVFGGHWAVFALVTILGAVIRYFTVNFQETREGVKTAWRQVVYEQALNPKWLSEKLQKNLLYLKFSGAVGLALTAYFFTGFTIEFFNDFTTVPASEVQLQYHNSLVLLKTAAVIIPLISLICLILQVKIFWGESPKNIRDAYERERGVEVALVTAAIINPVAIGLIALALGLALVVVALAIVFAVVAGFVWIVVFKLPDLLSFTGRFFYRLVILINSNLRILSTTAFVVGMTCGWVYGKNAIITGLAGFVCQLLLHFVTVLVLKFKPNDARVSGS